MAFLQHLVSQSTSLFFSTLATAALSAVPQNTLCRGAVLHRHRFDSTVPIRIRLSNFDPDPDSNTSFTHVIGNSEEKQNDFY